MSDKSRQRRNRVAPYPGPRGSGDGALAVPRPPKPPRRVKGGPHPRRGRHRRHRWPLWLGFGLALVAAVPLLLLLVLRYVPPPTTAYMLQSPTRPVSYQWVPEARIADTARRAVVASEDQRFFEHYGFDFDAISQALDERQRTGRQRGASTISQQLARNLFLWPGGGWFRKALEAGITVPLELLWPKERILEVYLNIAEFGPGIYGVEAAAQHYFGKPASALRASEAARLAAVLPSPRRWRAEPPGDYVLQRSQWILGQMGHTTEPASPGEVPVTTPEAAERRAPDDGFAADGEDGARGGMPGLAPGRPEPVAPGEGPR